MRLYAVTTVLILTAAAHAAEAVEVRARLEAPEIPFHRTARLVVEVEAAKDVEPRIGTIEGAPASLDIEEAGFESVSIDDTLKLVRQSWTLECPNTGLYRIPPVTVSWGEGERAETPPMVLRIRDLTDTEREAAENFVDITTPEPRSTATDTVLRWGAGIGACAIVLAGLFWFLLRKKEEPATPPPKPWEVADRRLAELSRRRLPEQGAYDQYYVDLSAILRYYLEDRFNLHAPDLTTPELLKDVVEKRVLNEKQQEFLASFLRHCDYVKFAQYKPSAEEMAGGFTTVRQFVYDTIPRQATEPETEAA